MTAVCYRCFYRGPASEDQRCPACDFALIIEADEPTCEKHLADIMGRYSVRAGAPKLPGIKTHHGLAGSPVPGVTAGSDETGAPKKRFFAVGTVPPPRAAADVARAQQAPLAAASQSPIVAAPVPRVAAKAKTEVPAPVPSLDIAPAEPQSLVRRSFGFIEVTCVLLGALAAGVGAAFLGTAL